MVWVGVIIKSLNSIVYSIKMNCGGNSNIRGEFLACWCLPYVASPLNIQSMQIYGDYRIVID